jgi:hypothetical protein
MLNLKHVRSLVLTTVTLLTINLVVKPDFLPLNIGQLQAHASMDTDVSSGTVLRLTLKNGANVNLSGTTNGGMINSWLNGNDGDSQLVWIPIGNNRGYFLKEGTNMAMSVKSLTANSTLEMWTLVPGAWQQVFTMVPSEDSGMYYVECGGMRVNVPFSKHNVRLTLMPNKGRDVDQMFNLNIVGKTTNIPNVGTAVKSISTSSNVLKIGEYVVPVKGATVTQLSGEKISHSNYSGVDFGTGSTNPPAYAVFGGKVLNSSWDPSGGGNSVKVLSDNNEIQYYWHLKSRSVSTGDTIVAGQEVGKVGSTGNSTGNHLHVEFRTSTGTLNWWRAANFEQVLGLYNGKRF